MANGINGTYDRKGGAYFQYPYTLILTGNNNTGQLTGSVEYSTFGTTPSGKISFPITYGVFRFLNGDWPGPTAGTITVMQNDKFILNLLIFTTDTFETIHVFDQGMFFPRGDLSLAKSPAQGTSDDFIKLSLNPALGDLMGGPGAEDGLVTDAGGVIFNRRV